MLKNIKLNEKKNKNLVNLKLCSESLNNDLSSNLDKQIIINKNKYQNNFKFTIKFLFENNKFLPIEQKQIIYYFSKFKNEGKLKTILDLNLNKKNFENLFANNNFPINEISNFLKNEYNYNQKRYLIYLIKNIKFDKYFIQNALNYKIDSEIINFLINKFYTFSNLKRWNLLVEEIIMPIVELYDNFQISNIFENFIKYFNVMITSNLIKISYNFINKDLGIMGFMQLLEGIDKKKYLTIFNEILAYGNMVDVNFLKNSKNIEYIQILFEQILLNNNNLDEQSNFFGCFIGRITINENLVTKLILSINEQIYIKEIINQIFIQMRYSGSFNQLLSKLLDKIENLELDKTYYSKIYQLIEENILDDEIKIKIFEKVNNIFPLLYKKAISTVRVNVDPTKPFSSISEFLSNNDWINKKWAIKFENLGSTGFGLVKDFYSRMFEELKSFFIEKDGYLYVNNQNKKEFWNKIGVALGRIFSVEQIIIGLNLHPILLFQLLLQNRDQLNIYDNLFNQNFDNVETIINARKLANLSEKEWQEYKNLENIKYQNKEEFVSNNLKHEYIKNCETNLNEFLNGFQFVANSNKLKYFKLEYFSKFFLFEKDYVIFGEEKSLEKNIFIHGKLNKKLFLETIQEIMHQDINQFKSLLKFWFGTDVINDFSCNKASLNFSGHIKNNIMVSQTCYNDLILPKTLSGINDDQQCRHFLKEIIKNTLENQKIAETFNLQMQNG